MLVGMAAPVWRAAAQQEQPAPSRRQNGPKPRGTPAICLYSDQLLKVGYEELAGMIHMLGFDGVELMVQPGGHIGPQLADLHLERGIEAMNGSGVDVYAIGTSFTSPADPTVRLALGWGGEMGVPVFRPGHWKFNGSEPEARLLEVQREIAALAAMGRQTGISLAIHNGTADCVGGSLWDLYFILRGMDPRAVGYDFDIGYAAGQSGESGWQTVLRLALPRLKMVTARDCPGARTPAPGSSPSARSARAWWTGPSSWPNWPGPSTPDRFLCRLGIRPQTNSPPSGSTSSF
jgi:hypothetical protein